MLYHNVRVMAHSLRFIDSGAVVASCAIAYVVTPAASRGIFGPATHVGLAFILFTVVTVLSFLVIGERMRLYHAHRTESLAGELRALGEVVLYSAALGCTASQIGAPGMGPAFYGIAVSVLLIAALAFRTVLRVIVRRLRKSGRDHRTWLVVGQNDRSRRLLETVRNNPHFGIRIDQVCDLNPRQPRRKDTADHHSVQVLTSAESIRRILSERVIDEVVITLPLRTFYDEVQAILEICCEAGISAKLFPQAFDQLGARTEMSLVGNTALITHFNGPSDYMHLVVKRLVDVVGSSIGLLLLSPLFALIAIAVKLSSRGPVFFVQTRVGLHGRRFRMYKFRSMNADAPMRKAELIRYNASDGVAFKMKNDPRITSVGRVLRRFHLDEIPQLWNVLKGDMSIVGPRPLPIKEAEGNEWWHRRRLSMPPGLTCFWQVAADHKMPFQQWMQLDLKYIDGWSVWLDLKIIVSTLNTVARGKGW